MALAASLWPAVAQAAGDRGRTPRPCRSADVTVTVPEQWPVHRPRRAARAASASTGTPSTSATRAAAPARPHLVGRTEAGAPDRPRSLQGVIAPDRVVTADRGPVGVVVAAGDDTPAPQEIAASVRFDDAPADVTTLPAGPDARTFGGRRPHASGAPARAARVRRRTPGSPASASTPAPHSR